LNKQKIAALPADWNSKANQLLAADKLPDLQIYLEQVLRSQPDAHEARHLLGVCLGMQGRHDEALVHLSMAIALADFEPDWLFNLGNVLRSAGQIDLALFTYRKLLSAAPGHAHAWFNLGNLLADQKQDVKAVEAYRRALMTDPSYLKAMINLAGALSRTSDFDGALNVYRQIIAGDPKHVGARNNMANLLRDLGRPQEAHRILLEMSIEDPSSARAQNNLGSAWRETGHLPEALACYRRALELKPDYPEGQMNYGMALLSDGQWEDGWKSYEARLDTRLQGLVPPQHANIKPWAGQDPKGKRILVHGEQGLGDMLQFCRFVPLLASRGAQVVLVTDRHLKRLLSTLDFSGVVVTEGDSVPGPFDYQVSLLSLPLHLGIFRPDQFIAQPYLKAQPQEVAQWQAQLDEWFKPQAQTGRVRVGLVWAGNPLRDMPLASLMDRRRSLPLESVGPFLQLPHIDWVSLQKGEQESALPSIPSAAFGLNDFANTAALAQALDAVVTVDTSVAHLSASLGRPTFMLSRFDACWRWGLSGAKTPWYDTMHICRQPGYGDWTGALEEVRALLGEFVLKP
jgi:tetratricopeptide (TPR) repeat protein